MAPLLLTSHSSSGLPSLTPTSGRTRTLTMTLPLTSLALLPSARAASSSSKVVVVAYDPCGEELRLCGGEGRLRKPVSTVTESALPFSRLGGERGDLGKRPRAPPMFDVLGFCRLLLRGVPEPFETEETLRSTTTSPPGVELVDSGLVGTDLPTCRGGCGNAPMLTVLRSDLPTGRAPGRPSSPGNEGTEGERALLCFELGRYDSADEERARLVLVAEGSNEPRGAAPMLEPLDFATGNEGRGPVGGAIEGRAGRGSELPDISTALARRCDCYCSFWGVLAMHCWPNRLCFFVCSMPPRTCPWPQLSSPDCK
jgi:hypothetical protein